jgi:thiamine-phosphate pyrophosphorylase
MPPPTSGIKGLYAITPDEHDTALLRRKVRLALEGGARLVQYRNKCADPGLRLEQAHALRAVTREFDALLIVNDDAALALATDADGVHLGRDDVGPAHARALLGAQKIIGVSCYNRPSLARAAVANGADYVAFGAFFPSTVKPEAAVAGLDMLRAARQEIRAPIVAIGGITANNGRQVVEAGADALAVISALFDAADIAAAARDFEKLFIRNSAP